MTTFHEFLVPEFRDSATFDAVRVCANLNEVVMFQPMIPEIRASYVESMMRVQKMRDPDTEWDINDEKVYEIIYNALEDATFVQLRGEIKTCFLISYDELKQVMKSSGMLSSELSILND